LLKLAYSAPSVGIDRTFARQLPRALAFASTTKREASPRAATGRSAQVAAADAEGAKATSKRAGTVNAKRGIAGMRKPGV
jgi:hypothetical protein